MNIEKIDIIGEIFEKKIYNQILNIILEDENLYDNNNTINEINNQNIEINNKNDDNTSNKKMLYKSQFAEKEKNIKNSMSVILENAPEEEENDLFDGRGTVIQNNTGEEFDLTANIMNNFINMHHQKFINEEINYNNNIISFPNFQLIKEI